MEKIPGWVEKIFTPKVNELIGEVKALNTKVDSLRNETKSELASLRNETKSVEKMAEFEVRIAEIEKKLSVHA